LPSEHIPELGHFINAGSSQELSDFRYPWIVLHFKGQTPRLIKAIDLPLLEVRAHSHGSEFNELKPMPVLTHAGLNEENRSAGICFYPDDDEKKSQEKDH
jgi:hypothetical protein